MRAHAAINRIRLVAAFFVAITLFATLNMMPNVQAAGGLNNRSVSIASSASSATTTHEINFTITVPASPLGSVEIEYCSNDPLPGTACTPPSGFDLSGATLAGQTGNTGFSIDPSSTANRIILTRFAALPMAAASTYTFNNVVNPDDVGTYYVRLRTFSSTDATGTAIEDGGLVFAITSQINVTAEVPPYLRFCVGVTISAFDCSTGTEYLIDLGDFSTTKTTVASSEFLIATNAGLGYTTTIYGTTLTSGNNEIPALTSPTASNRGTSQFGINLRANSSPAIGAEPVGPGVGGTINSNYSQPNSFAYNSSDVLITSSTTTDYKKYTISYLTNVGSAQAPGVYAATFSLICLANF